MWRELSLLCAAVGVASSGLTQPAEETPLAQATHLCETKDMAACHRLGVMYASGQGVAKDLAKAAQLYQKACDGGQGSGCTNLGYLYDTGEGVPKDAVKAAQLYLRGCDGGNAQGCFNLGYDYDNGEGVPKDVAKAAQFYQRACDGGNVRGCSNLGYDYAHGEGVPKDVVKAAQLYQKACDGGNAPSCTNLGFAYDNGQGVAKDLVKAAQLYQKACDGGNAWGCFNLAYDYSNGEGVARDAAKAAPLYQKACDGGIAAGCTNLGVLYVDGRGVTKDSGKAAELYGRGCKGGDTQGCTNLGVLHANAPPPAPTPGRKDVLPAAAPARAPGPSGAKPPVRTATTQVKPEAAPRAARVALPSSRPVFEVVSARAVASAQSASGQIKFNQDDTGVVVILKRAPATEGMTVHSTDFVLVFKSDSDIPRRPCLAISHGMKSASDEAMWATVASGEYLSRNRIEAGEPYFALLFPAPRSVSTFSLHQAAPLSPWFTLGEQGPWALQAVKGAQPPELEVAATQVVTRAESTLHRLHFPANNHGVVVILRRAVATDTLMVHSNDFVLVLKTDNEDFVISRRPCLGISRGMKSAGEEVQWSNVGGGVSRYWIEPGESYFALLFPAPTNISTFSLQGAVPLSPWFTLEGQASGSSGAGGLP